MQFPDADMQVLHVGFATGMRGPVSLTATGTGPVNGINQLTIIPLLGRGYY